MAQGVTGEPDLIVTAGDWHRNIRWAVAKIRRGAQLLTGQAEKVFLHFGDFGFYPDRRDLMYLRAVSGTLLKTGARILVVDGNHENHDMLAAVAAAARQAGAGPPYEVVPSVFWLPRGHRWVWHGRTWLAVGGGVSVNRALLTEGFDWFPAEQITDEQEAAIVAGGPADVIVSHDCPAGVAHGYPRPQPGWDLADLARAAVHGERLQRIGGKIRPRHWMHGHLHMGYQRDTDIGWGPVQVTGLNRDGDEDKNSPYNTAVLDIRDMTWRPYD